MAIQGVTGQNYYEKLRGNARTQQKKETSDFLENMSEKTDRLPQEADTDYEVNPYTYVRTDRYSNSLQTKIMVQDNGFEEIDPQELPKELMGEKTEEKEDDMMSLTLQEAMQKFYDYVKDRIENGDPEIPIGGASMSIREWEKLLEKVDENLDELREAKREEQEKREEKDEQVVKAVTEEQIARLLEEREEKQTI